MSKNRSVLYNVSVTQSCVAIMIDNVITQSIKTDRKLLYPKEVENKFVYEL